MISLHHAHLMATDINATIAFSTDGFDGKVVLYVPFAGARTCSSSSGPDHSPLPAAAQGGRSGHRR